MIFSDFLDYVVCDDVMWGEVFDCGGVVFYELFIGGVVEDCVFIVCIFGEEDVEVGEIGWVELEEF